ncbi:MAG: WXG100 family type VII secretion target [Clostridiales bacterium]|nr:WXG100 family type VII secretion target [Clostridiales bacterium]
MSEWLSPFRDIAGNLTATLGGSVTLVVTPEALYTQAEAVAKRISSMQTQFDEIEAAVSGTSAYWVGDAGDAHRAAYEERLPEIEEIFKRLSEFVTDLEQIAGVYEETEKAVTEIAEDLPADVII